MIILKVTKKLYPLSRKYSLGKTTGRGLKLTSPLLIPSLLRVKNGQMAQTMYMPSITWKFMNRIIKENFYVPTKKTFSTVSNQPFPEFYIYFCKCCCLPKNVANKVEFTVVYFAESDE